jgi:hypothetical protein
MKNLLRFTVILLVAACTTSEDYNPDQLSAEDKDALLTNVIRYIGKEPPKTGTANKFDKAFDKYYLDLASRARLVYYYKKNDYQYFAISQPAPSLVEKRHLTGGRFKEQDGHITDYEEIFRTWKMVPDTLQKRSYVLFDKLVKGESLEPYLTKNSNGVEYIEFPDHRTYYDKEERRWKVK